MSSSERSASLQHAPEIPGIAWASINPVPLPEHSVYSDAFGGFGSTQDAGGSHFTSITVNKHSPRISGRASTGRHSPQNATTLEVRIHESGYLDKDDNLFDLDAQTRLVKLVGNRVVGITMWVGKEQERPVIDLDSALKEIQKTLHNTKWMHNISDAA